MSRCLVVMRPGMAWPPNPRVQRKGVPSPESKKWTWISSAYSCPHDLGKHPHAPDGRWLLTKLPPQKTLPVLERTRNTDIGQRHGTNSWQDFFQNHPCKEEALQFASRKTKVPSPRGSLIYFGGLRPVPSRWAGGLLSLSLSVSVSLSLSPSIHRPLHEISQWLFAHTKPNLNIISLAISHRVPVASIGQVTLSHRCSIWSIPMLPNISGAPELRSIDRNLGSGTLGPFDHQLPKTWRLESTSRACTRP